MTSPAAHVHHINFEFRNSRPISRQRKCRNFTRPYQKMPATSRRPRRGLARTPRTSETLSVNHLIGLWVFFRVVCLPKMSVRECAWLGLPRGVGGCIKRVQRNRKQTSLMMVITAHANNAKNAVPTCLQLNYARRMYVMGLGMINKKIIFSKLRVCLQNFARYMIALFDWGCKCKLLQYKQRKESAYLKI